MAELSSRFYLQQVPIQGQPLGSSLRLDLNMGEQLVGGQPDVALPVPLPGIAPMHATLWVQLDAVFVTDLGAEGGTTINAQPLEEGQPAALEIGDEINFGGVAAFVLYRGQPQAAEDEQQAESPAGGAGPGLSLADLALAGRSPDELLKNYFDVFVSFCHGVSNAADRYELLDRLLGFVAQIVPADRHVVLLGDRPEAMQVRAARYRDEAVGAHEGPSSEFVKRVVESRDPVVAFDALVDERFSGRDSVIAQNVRAAVGVRLAARGKILGVLYMDSQESPNAFSEDDSRFVHALGIVASLGLLYLASRTALRDLMVRSREQVVRLQGAAKSLAEHLFDSSDRLYSAAEQIDDPGIAELLRDESERLAAAVPQAAEAPAPAAEVDAPEGSTPGFRHRKM